MTIVISGASGQLGRRVTELLLDRLDPADLVLVTRSPAQLEHAVERGAHVRKGDFDDPAGLDEAFRGAERMLLISVEPISKQRPHRNALEAAKAAGVEFVAYTSFVNPTAENPAGISGEHRETERMLRASGMSWAFLRNSTYAEMQVANAQAALASGSLVHNAGAGRIAYVSRDDCAAAAAAVVAGGGHDGRTYDVTGPAALAADEVAALYAELGGRAVAAVAVDDRTLVRGMVQSGLPVDIAELLASFGAAARAGYLETVSSAVQDLTGRPPHTFRAVMEKHRDALEQAAGTVAAT